MKTLFTLSFLLAAVVSTYAEGWLLKVPSELKSRQTWKITINASIGGQDIESTMEQSLSITAKSEKQITGKVGWANIQINGSSNGFEPPAWDVMLNSNGSILKAGEGPDFLRQLAATTFIYPDKEVKEGDKWTAKFGKEPGTREIVGEYEVIEQTKVGEADTLMIRVKQDEEGGLHTEGTFWLAKDGSVMKFVVGAKHWPIVGANTPPIDATIKGHLVK